MRFPKLSPEQYTPEQRAAQAEKRKAETAKPEAATKAEAEKRKAEAKIAAAKRAAEQKVQAEKDRLKRIEDREARAYGRTKELVSSLLKAPGTAEFQSFFSAQDRLGSRSTHQIKLHRRRRIEEPA